MADNFNDYRREKVLLHTPYKSEENEVITDKFIQVYENNKDLILERRKELKSNKYIDEPFEICKQLCR